MQGGHSQYFKFSKIDCKEISYFDESLTYLLTFVKYHTLYAVLYRKVSKKLNKLFFSYSVPNRENSTNSK